MTAKKRFGQTKWALANAEILDDEAAKPHEEASATRIEQIEVDAAGLAPAETRYSWLCI